MATLPVDVVVAADGSGDYSTVAAAIAAAPLKSERRHVIHIKRGVYKEFVVLDEDLWNLALVGDGMDATVISGSRCCADGFRRTPQTSVLTVHGRGFMARDLCVENTAGPKNEQGQAVALFSDSDESVLYRCTLRSYQDTLYAKTGKQFYRDCKISGTVDFIFGDAAAVFQNCDILARLPIQGQQNTVTAQGRKTLGSNGGFCFQMCRLAADDDLRAKAGVDTYLGRPWKPYARVVFMQSNFSDVLDAKGWLPWENAAPPDTIYYAEYDNNGPGAAVGGRVNWSGFHAIRDAAEASNFTVEKFIDGNNWLPSTGVDYKPGL